MYKGNITGAMTQSTVRYWAVIKWSDYKFNYISFQKLIAYTFYLLIWSLIHMYVNVRFTDLTRFFFSSLSHFKTWSTLQLIELISAPSITLFSRKELPITFFWDRLILTLSNSFPPKRMWGWLTGNPRHKRISKGFCKNNQHKAMHSLWTFHIMILDLCWISNNQPKCIRLSLCNIRLVWYSERHLHSIKNHGSISRTPPKLMLVSRINDDKSKKNFYVFISTGKNDSNKTFRIERIRKQQCYKRIYVIIMIVNEFSTLLAVLIYILYIIQFCRVTMPAGNYSKCVYKMKHHIIVHKIP